MLFQLIWTIEIYFLFYVTGNVIGFQVFIYLLYIGVKNRKVRLLTHNIILPLGLLLLFETIMSIMLLHSKFGLTDPPNIVILHTFSLNLVIIIIFIFISFISFNVVLISPTIKRIKIKLIPIIFSQILIIISLYLDVFILYNALSIIFFILGILIIFITFFSGSLINAFLNIKGSETLRGLYIINTVDHRCLYHYDFTQKNQVDQDRYDLSKNLEHNLEEVFFSEGIEGIENLVAAITNTQDEKIHSISQGGALLILEHGSKYDIPLTYVLIADKGQKNMRFLLNILKNQFELIYKEILMNFKVLKGNQALVFNSFDIVVNNIIE